jgi:uncharacterized NAD(P)/FAD-binding protein YdhS
LSSSRALAVVGAGLSGTLVATNLLRSQHWAATRIVLIERSAQVARGVAYAERDHPFLLNVPAGRMSADSGSPLDFLSFAQNRIPGAGAEDFLPRALYGQYLEATLLGAEVAAAPHVQFEKLLGDVQSLQRIEEGSGYRLQLADGRVLDADDVVLALGNPPPAHLPGTEALRSGYVPDPWARPLSISPGATVLLIGTGLTMVDAALAATSSTNGDIVVHALSRHGLIPPSQTQFSTAACKGDSNAMLRAATFSARTLVSRIRSLARESEALGGDWRETITFIRNIAPALWQRLPPRERRRLLRHVRPYWDIHRHRLPGETASKLDRLRRDGRLSVHAGRLLAFENVGDKVRVTWRARGQDEAQTLLVDRVVNCTGPDYDVTRSRDPLMQSLISQGLAVADPLRLGIRTGSYGAMIDASGRPASNLFYIGPMLRADYWEATAVQELRGHAERLAGYLSAPVGRLWAAAGT